MPTTLPREGKAPILFLVFICVLFAAAFVWEMIDPQPIDVDASTIASP